MKLCPGCGKAKEASEYHKDRSSSTGLQTRCKACKSAARKTFRSKYPDRVREQRRKSHQRQKELGTVYYTGHKEEYRDAALRKRYGISVAEFNDMWNRQNGLCCICSERKLLGVDHDHRSGKVRGLLCKSCNFGIGYLKDSPKLLQQAIEYLQ